MTGITPRLPGRLVHSHRPLKMFYLARHYQICIVRVRVWKRTRARVLYNNVTSCLSVLITASGLQGEKPLANGIK
jgi:hypothetical protein